jgi:hypothetical protein
MDATILCLRLKASGHTNHARHCGFDLWGVQDSWRRIAYYFATTTIFVAALAVVIMGAVAAWGPGKERG